MQRLSWDTYQFLCVRFSYRASAELQLYKVAVLPHLTYCHMIWHFCKASDSRKLAHVQERGLRAVFCDKNSSYDHLLIKARLPSLMNRRLQHISCLMYKVKNNLCPKYICDLFKLNNCVHNLRVKEFIVPRFETVTFGKHSLKYLGAKIQPHIRHSPSLGSFKRAIRKVCFFFLKIRSNFVVFIKMILHVCRCMFFFF